MFRRCAGETPALPEGARANRSFLHGLYAVLKSCDAHIAFTPLAGVSKFDILYVFEFKTVTVGLRARRWRRPRREATRKSTHDLGQPVCLIGVEFSEAEHNVAAFEVAAA